MAIDVVYRARGRQVNKCFKEVIGKKYHKNYLN